MNPVLTALAVIIIGSALWCWRRRIFCHNVPALPGAKPLIGHALLVFRNMNRILDWQLEACQQMGFKTFCITIPTVATYYMMTDPTCLEYILRIHSDGFTKGPSAHSQLACVLGGGTVSNAEQWHWQHKMATEALSGEKFQKHISQVLWNKVNILVTKLSDSAADGSSINLQELLQSLTLDCLCESLLGVDLGTETTDDKAMIAAALNRSQAVVNRRLLLPCWQVVEVLDGSRSHLAQDISLLRQFAGQAISTCRQQLAAAQALGLSQAMDSLPCGVLPQLLHATGPGGRPLEDEQLISTVLNLLIAGSGTIAQATCWTLHQLMQHPDCQKRLVAEVKEKLGDRALNDGDLMYDDTRELRYTRACFLEALRLNPPVPMDVRYASCRQLLPDGSVIAKGTRILCPIYCINRMISYWGSTAQQYRPERWLEMDDMPSSYSYMAFSAGLRSCPGQQLAELVGLALLAGLLSRFKFSQVVPGQKITYQKTGAVQMELGLLVGVAKDT